LLQSGARRDSPFFNVGNRDPILPLRVDRQAQRMPAPGALLLCGRSFVFGLGFFAAGCDFLSVD